MKNLWILLLVPLALSCSDDEDGDDFPDVDYREEMRNFVIEIKNEALKTDPDFIVIPQNGIELVAMSEDDMTPCGDYLDAIDGNGQEDLYYGYNNDDELTPVVETDYLCTLLNISKNAGNTILVTDYCWTHSKMNNCYSWNNVAGYVAFAADERELNNIPDYPENIYGENASSMTRLSDVKNFLYLINPENYTSKEAFISAVTATNYDLLIMDYFFSESDYFTDVEVNQLKQKANGGTRLVIAYMSIGEAEDYRYYWKEEWNETELEWLEGENPDWEGNYKVQYWNSNWKAVIYGQPDSYLTKILDSEFNGVYLDIIEAFEYFE